MLLIFEQPDHPIVMWSKPIVLSSNYCKNKRGIVGDDEYASWEYADVMFILCFYYDVMVIIYFDEFHAFLAQDNLLS